MNTLLKICLTTALTSVIGTSSFALTADEIMHKVDALETPRAVKSKMTMVLIDSRNNQRLRSLQTVRIKQDETTKSLMFFTEPTDVRGTGFLMFDYELAEQDDDQWMFLPALGKAKRIANGDTTGSFMGSDFTYADMTKRNVEDWTFTLIKEDTVNNQAVWVIEALPRNDEVIERTGYVRSITYIRQDSFQVIRGINYLPKDGEVKLMDVSKSELIDGFWFGTEVQMISQKNKKIVHRTVMTTDDIDLDFDVDPNSFTLTGLEQGL